MQNQAGTILYDAVYLAANDRLRSDVGRKAIVLITDGVDTGSKISRDKAIEGRAESRCDHLQHLLCGSGAYGFGNFGGGGGEGELRRMSSETGGQVFRVDRGHSLDEIFREIQEEMRSQYAITYQPPSPKRDGTYHKIDIKLSNKDYKSASPQGLLRDRARELGKPLWRTLSACRVGASADACLPARPRLPYDPRGGVL